MNDTRTLTEAETATLLRLKQQTLRSWRYRDLGPPYLKIVGTIRYLEADLDKYLRTRRVQPTAADR